MPESSDRRRRALVVLLPLLIFAGLYFHSIDYPFVWTDHGEIEQAAIILPPDRLVDAVTSPMLVGLVGGGTARPYYRPLQVIVASAVDAGVGRSPRSFRGVALALGAATTLLFTLFAWSISRSSATALVAGSLYAAHPAGIETYVWIAGLGQALASLFLIASLWTGLSAMRLLSEDERRPGYALALLSLGLLLLALFSKESSVVAPALLLLCWIADRILQAAPRSVPAEVPAPEIAPLHRRLLQPSLALVFLHGLVVAWYALVLRPAAIGGALASIPPVGGSLRLQVLTSVASWPGTLAWLFVPVQSTTSDVVRLVYAFRDPQLLVALALLLVSVVAWGELSRRGYAVAALGIAWIWVAFLPTSGIIPLTHFRAVRYLAVSVFGFALFLPAFLDMALRGVGVRRRELALLCIGLLCVGGLAERSWRRVPDWESGVRLFRHDVERDPLYREGYHMLAEELAREQRLGDAKEIMDELFAIGSDFEGHTSYLNYSNASAFYCDISLHLGRPEDNLLFEEQMRPDSPDLHGSPYAFYECGARTFEALGQLERALEILLALDEIEYVRRRSLYRVATARCLARLGRKEEAEQWLDRIPRESLRDPALLSEVWRVREMLR